MTKPLIRMQTPDGHEIHAEQDGTWHVPHDEDLEIRLNAGWPWDEPQAASDIGYDPCRQLTHARQVADQLSARILEENPPEADPAAVY